MKFKKGDKVERRRNRHGEGDWVDDVVSATSPEYYFFDSLPEGSYERSINNVRARQPLFSLPVETEKEVRVLWASLNHSKSLIASISEGCPSVTGIGATYTTRSGLWAKVDELARESGVDTSKPMRPKEEPIEVGGYPMELVDGGGVKFGCLKLTKNDIGRVVRARQLATQNGFSTILEVDNGANGLYCHSSGNMRVDIDGGVKDIDLITVDKIIARWQKSQG